MLVTDAVTSWLTPSAEGCHIGRPVSRAWRKARTHLARHLVLAIGDADAACLTHAHVWRIQEYGRAAGLSSETINKITCSVLPGMLRDMETAGHLPAGCRDGIKGAGRLRATSEAGLYPYTISERDRMLEAFAGHWSAPMVTFLFLTGCRVGEAAGLRQGDFDWRRPACNIMRSRSGREVTPCKTRRSQRRIDLPDELAAVLAPLRTDEPAEYFFRGARGEPVHIDSFRHEAWTRIPREAGLRPIRIHDARHGWATIALESGVPLAEVAAYLGDTIELTERRYAHVRPRFNVNAAVSRPVAPPPAAAVVAERHLRLVPSRFGGGVLDDNCDIAGRGGGW